MNKRFFDFAKKASKLSTHHTHKMGSCLVKKGKVLALGTNKLKTHPRSPSPFSYIHCELDCILNSRLEDLTGCEIYIFRETKSQKKLASAKPCPHCFNLLKSLNIKRIHFSDYEGYRTT